MVRLAIIADDLTGSLDTGIKFTRQGIRTQIFLNRQISMDTVLPDTEVIVIDTESRHLPAKEAGEVVADVIGQCMEHGIHSFYKKTDSALRGHVGMELAVLAGKTGKTVRFVPALPQEDRYTENGIHYIRGVPVAESIFGTDSLNPVRHSELALLIREEAPVSTDVISLGGWREPSSGTDIAVYDGRTKEDLEMIADRLEAAHALDVTAGCAGFAPFLASKLGLSLHETESVAKKDKLIVISGSINSVTDQQLKYAEGQGFSRRILDPHERMAPGYLETMEGRKLLAEIDGLCDSCDRLIIDVLAPDPVAETQEHVKTCSLCRNCSSLAIAERLAELFVHITGRHPEAAIMIIGGDTFFAAMKQYPGIILNPVCEPVEGTVYVEGITKDHNLSLLSKSGGFGEKDLLIKLADIML